MKLKVPTFVRSSNGNSVRNIIDRSTKAVCGVFEREVVVPNSKVISTKLKLKGSGYIIIGTGKAGSNSTRIWFNPAGVNL